MSANKTPCETADMTVPCSDGFINIRVGAIILKDEKVLMVRNSNFDYYYTVGGRVQFGETAQQAVIREVYEETGCKMAVDRLGFIHENYYICDIPSKFGKTIYEICYYFYMRVPDDFTPVCHSKTYFGSKEKLEWLDIDSPNQYFPDFFRTELKMPCNYVKFISDDERKNTKCEDTGL